MRGDTWLVTLYDVASTEDDGSPVYKNYEARKIKLHDSGVLETWWENSEGWRSDLKFHAPGTWRTVEEKH